MAVDEDGGQPRPQVGMISGSVIDDQMRVDATA